MRVYLNDTVVEKAKERIEWILKEFDEVCVSVSGGKDSLVIKHLTLNIAEELGETPVYMLWLDQEAEWKTTSATIEKWMKDDRVEPLWYQIPFYTTNAMSDEDEYLHAWDPEFEGEWVREKHPMSIKENDYGVDRFFQMFNELMHQDMDLKGKPDKIGCSISGMRAEESPGRSVGITTSNTYKGITWGYRAKENLKLLHPIYDWSYTDVWKYIFENDLDYNPIYDALFRHGQPVHNMRVSSLVHETAVNSLFVLQELEPNTYEDLARRLKGVDTAGKIGPKDFVPSEVPYMFKDWREYRNFLLEKLVDKEEHYNSFLKTFFQHDLMYEDFPEVYESLLKGHVKGILSNDWEADSVIQNALYNASCKLGERKREIAKARKEKKMEYLEREGILQELRDEGIINFWVDLEEEDD